MFNEAPSDFFLIIFGISLIMLVMVRIFLPGYLNELIRAFLNPNFTQLLYEERKLKFTSTQILLDILFIVSFSLVWMLYLGQNEFGAFLKLSVIIAGFYIIRLTAISTVGYLFFGTSLNDSHKAEVILFNRIFAFVFLIVSFILFYLRLPEISTYLLTSIMVVIISGYAWRFLRIFQRIHSIRGHGYFYILLYLCAIELSPFILLVKALTSP